VSDGTFFVNSDGLDTGKDGFHEKGNQIQDLALRIKDLMNPSRVAAAAGNDQNGRTFAQQHLASAAKIHDAISSWGEVVSGTTDAIGGMANSFRRTDEVVTDAGTQLGKSFLQLNNETDQALNGSGSGGDNGDGGGNSPSGSSTLRLRNGQMLSEIPRSNADAAVSGVSGSTAPTHATPAHLVERVPSVPASSGATNLTVQLDSQPAARVEKSAAEPLTPAVSTGELLSREPSLPPTGNHP
jgi:hypothetical protein